MERTLYDALGLSPYASWREIRAACLELGARYKSAMEAGEDGAAERFAEIERAYETLTDKAKRATYNAELAIQAKRDENWRWLIDQFRDVDPITVGVIACLVIAGVFVSLSYRSPEEQGARTPVTSPAPAPLRIGDYETAEERAERMAPYAPTLREMERRERTGQTSRPDDDAVAGRVYLRQRLEGNPISESEVRAITRAARSIIENDRRNEEHRPRQR